MKTKLIRKVSVSCIVCLLSINLYSQTNFGVNTKGHISHSGQISGGFGIGLVTETKLTSSLNLNLELNYFPFYTIDITDNFNIRDKYGNIYDRVYFDTQLLNIPVKINYRIANRLFIEGGIVFNYKLEIDHSVEENNEELLVFTEGAKKFDYGIMVGVGYDITNKLVIKVGRNFGVNEILPNNSNDYFSISLNYFFKRFQYN